MCGKGVQAFKSRANINSDNFLVFRFLFLTYFGPRKAVGKLSSPFFFFSYNFFIDRFLFLFSCHFYGPFFFTLFFPNLFEFLNRIQKNICVADLFMIDPNFLPFLFVPPETNVTELKHNVSYFIAFQFLIYSYFSD